MDVVELHRRATEAFAVLVGKVGADEWHRPTPCVGWDVRTLVNHVVGEERWAVPLMAGRTIADVGTTLDGDLLGEDPASATVHAAHAAQIAVVEPVLRRAKVQLSYGAEDAAEYVNQLIADHLIHGWDLASAIGADRRMDPVVVTAVAEWFADREELYRSSGAIGPRPADEFADPADRLLAAFGRDPRWTPEHAVVAELADAFARRDVDAIMALMTDDCVFESTGPAPDGERFEGTDAVRAQWTKLFDETVDPEFHTEESFVRGDRALLRWRYTWRNPDGSPGHIRGVDVLRLRGGRIAEKLSYVKG
ncbi:MAG TPA: TIGR03086 family metal-binding protein [Kribbellaceae bacterium]|nr:TIGR03086 family metal-binding protein [Kribbellaceae bacterium]